MIEQNITEPEQNKGQNTISTTDTAEIVVNKDNLKTQQYKKYLQKAEQLFVEKNTKEALEYFKTAIELEPSTLEDLYSVAKSLYKNKQYKLAISCMIHRHCFNFCTTL